MKRSRLTWTLAAILVLSLTGSAFAAASATGRANPPNNNFNPPPSSAQSASEAKLMETAAKPDQATGALTSIDAQAMSLVLEVKAGPMHFKLSPTTEYLSGGTTAELATLTPGSTVRIEYRMEGTSRVASKVEVLPAAR